jgi:hypothetical protein
MPKPLYVKQEEAELRKAEHAKRSTNHQLELIASRRGESKKELAKLNANKETA